METSEGVRVDGYRLAGVVVVVALALLKTMVEGMPYW